ncbi:MAG: helix-hairpin-helix domain-containing protein [Acidimicrobiia bacterium]|nr:helix-hairpin-helix domain-containing protein [Acidimicrobiia bacterium]
MASRGTNLSVTSVGLAFLVLVGGALWFGIGTTPGASSAAPVDVVHTETGLDALITVHISGPVVVPGVVAVPEGSRVADAVAAAGGATRDADLGRLNLAAPIRDGEQIIVPAVVDTPDAGAQTSSARFDINTADEAGFEALPGIGPVIAERIVAYRDEHGPFETLESLLDVPGIGESKLDAIRSALAGG